MPRLRQTACWLSVPAIYGRCPIQVLLSKFAYISEQIPSFCQERVQARSKIWRSHFLLCGSYAV